MDPKDIAMGARWGIKLLQEAWQPGNQYAETQSILTDEEMRLLNQLRAGTPCVICGAKGTHAVEASICKFVTKVRTGALFWKKDTYYFDRRSVAAPLCSKHYFNAKCSRIVSKTMRCVGYLICILLAAMFSGLMLFLKQQGYCNCIMPDDDTETVIVWFGLGWFGFTILYVTLLDSLHVKHVNSESVWKYGPLRRLVELQWIKSGEAETKLK